MRKSLILFALTVFCVLNGGARTRSYTEILELARQHFTEQREVITRGETFSPVAIPSSSILTSMKTKGTLASEAFYVFNLEKDGFVIISGDDQMKPVLGYSSTDTFRISNIPDNMRNWLQLYANQFNYLSTSRHQTNTYLEIRATDSYPETVAPLLGNIIWDQGEPYNNNCPVIDGEKTVTGCVATAMAQVMKYHRYPEKGTSTKKYTSKTNKLNCELDFSGITFKWDQMLPSYQGTYTKENADAIAQLMYSCGVSIDMDYGLSKNGGSGAVDVYIPNAIHQYFQYDPNARVEVRINYTNAEWAELIKKELNEKRPVIYAGYGSGGGHEFVFDGYNSDGMFHINWGWSGYSNGYFEVWDLDPYALGIGGGTGGGFNTDQRIITGIQKPSSTSKFISNFIADSSLVINKTNISRNETFEVTTPIIYNYGRSFKGKFQLVLVKEQQVVAEIGEFLQNEKEIGVLNGIADYDFTNLIIPQQVTPGNYKLYFATKDQKETDWSLVKASVDQTSYFNVKVTDSQVLFSDSKKAPDLQVLAFNINHGLYQNGKGDYTMRLKNNGEEFFLQVGIIFKSKDGKSYLTAYNTPFIGTGEEKDITLSGTVKMPAGNYNIYICYSNDGEIWTSIPTETGITATVQPESTADPAITLTKKITVDKSIIKTGEPLKVSFTINNTGGIYSDDIYAAIFEKNGSDMSVDQFYKQVFIEPNKVQTFTMSGIPNIQEGEYIVALYYVKENEPQPLTPETHSFQYFTVNNKATANEYIDVSEIVSIYPSHATTLLNIEAGKNLHRIEIVNLSGAVVKQINQTVKSGSTYTISVSELATGIYFLRAYTGQQVYSHKFIKK